MAPVSIVIGASAGGLEATRDVVSQLPTDFPAPVFIVMHVPPYEPSLIPDILDRAGALRASHPQDHTKIEPGRIYVAPPDHHLLIDDSYVAVKRGPKENGFRPSIDALFRSAAYTFGPGAVGVVLSGALNDGTSGLWSIKRLGGTAIIQEPAGALYPSMPRSAMEYTEPDYRGAPSDIGKLLVQLVGQEPRRQPPRSADTEEVLRRAAIETQVAAGIQVPDQVILDLGELTQFTCPECRGTLVRITEGNSFRFRCHTGHGFTADALLEGLTATVGDLTWQAMRGSQETSMLLEHIAHHLQDAGESETAKRFSEKARELSRRAGELQKLATSQQNLSEENILDESTSSDREDTATSHRASRKS